jgi:anti-sigma factor RsiW
MNMHDVDTLDQELRSLQEDVPPMPEDFHAGWMKQVEEEAMQKQTRKTSWTRILSVAAALVFVVGGTLLSREDLAPERRSPPITAIMAPLPVTACAPPPTASPMTAMRRPATTAAWS